MEIQHFSHDHPLIYTKDIRTSLCSVCGVALLKSPSYKCSKDCDFFLHQPCTQLISSSKRAFGGFPYDLKLLEKTLHENCKCEKCEKPCTKFTYECSSRWFETFYLHWQCAFPLEINIEHISHHDHSLMTLCKEATLVCDACGREKKGIFFSCTKCSFHIDQDCCLLPTIAKINHHHHLLSLNYSLSKSQIWNKKCLICGDNVSLSFGAYICQYCERGAHLNCAAPELEEPEIVQASILPRKPDTFPSLIIRTLIDSREDSEIKDGESKIEKYHSDHSSWNIHHRESDIQLVCNACIQPIVISPPISHYSCPISQCDFLLHQVCANLPPTAKDYFWNRPLNFFSKSDGFCSVFSCDICGKRCNGSGYGDCDWTVFDVECIATPTTIKHIAHSPHLLALAIPWSAEYLCCDDFSSYAYSYVCSLCDYYIHVRCALLPKTVEHKFDEHPLDLIYDPIIQIPHEDEEKERHYLCEFCEEDLNQNFWFYHCIKCDQSFHVNCIPSTGKLSKIKFGCNIVLPRHVHDHPVTLTRMLIMGSQRCGICEDEILGFIDEMAFHCSMCDFWIHFRCAEDICFQ